MSIIRRQRTRGVLHLGTLLLALSSLPAVAQEAGPATAPVEADRYRVELLFFSRLEGAQPEYLEGAHAPTLPLGGELLHGPGPAAGRVAADNPEAGPAASGDERELEVSGFGHDLLPTDNLYLRQARDRLRNNGGYEIHFLAGWEEAFPPGHKTPPLVVRAGEIQDGFADIEGFIQIERQRYLHVTTQLYDLDLTSLESQATPAGSDTWQEDEPQSTRAPVDLMLLDSRTAPEETEAASRGPEVVTWMRETRRMRSGELHYLGAPTMGLLVYFEPLD